MELIDLIGEHVLTGVEFDTLPPTNCGDAPNVIRFTLDGKTYEASEDPSDGYRSCMQDIKETDRAVAAQFQPCRVVARYLDREDGGECDILECLDVVTGKSVLRVGTDRTDDYYPSFVSWFAPEAMAANAG